MAWIRSAASSFSFAAPTNNGYPTAAHPPPMITDAGAAASASALPMSPSSSPRRLGLARAVPLPGGVVEAPEMPASCSVWGGGNPLALVGAAVARLSNEHEALKGRFAAEVGVKAVGCWSGINAMAFFPSPYVGLALLALPRLIPAPLPLLSSPRPAPAESSQTRC